MLHNVELQPIANTPIAFDQYVPEGMQATLVALSQNEVFWYTSETATQAIAVGNYFTTPELFNTTTYYLEEQYQDDTLLCVSPRSSVTVYVLDPVLSADENEEVSNLMIYPNPTTGLFTIKSANMAKVEIYNLIGQKMHEAEGRSVSIDATEWNKGIYLVNIIEKNGAVVTKKLVVR